jgi:general stress protein CsbA
MTLNSRAWLAVAILASVMCALLFSAAGTTHHWQAWVYVSIFLGASALPGYSEYQQRVRHRVVPKVW